MEKEKVMELLKKEDFLGRIVKLETPEEVQSEFKKEGAEISIDEVKLIGEVINNMVENGGKPLDDEKLSEIAGGANYTDEDMANMGVSMATIGFTLGTAMMGTLALVTWGASKYAKLKRKYEKLKRK